MTEKTFIEQFPSLKGKSLTLMNVAQVTQSVTKDKVVECFFDYKKMFSKEDIQQHCLDKQIVERDYIKISSNDPFAKAAQELFIKNADSKEAFIIEELKDYIEFKDNVATLKGHVRLRLAEIEDYKQKVRDAISDMFCHQAPNVCECCKELENLKKELGI